MTAPYITDHAIERYRERVADLADADIRAALSTPTICAAAGMGDCRVILPSGHRAIIVDGAIVTVLLPYTVRDERAAKARRAKQRRRAA